LFSYNSLYEKDIAIISIVVIRNRNLKNVEYGSTTISPSNNDLDIPMLPERIKPVIIRPIIEIYAAIFLDFLNIKSKRIATIKVTTIAISGAK